MGWGTFILGRALRKRGESEPVFIPLMGFLAGKFYESYLHKIYVSTITTNPALQKTVDLNEWEEDIHLRAKRDWYLLLFILFVANALWLLVGVYFGFLFSPLIWYYTKHRLIQKAIKEINDLGGQTQL